MQGGCAVSFVAFFIALWSAVVAVFFWGRAQVFDRLITGKDGLIHWTYQPLEWQRYTEFELKEQMFENKGLLFIVAGWALFFGALFWLLDRESGWIVFLHNNRKG